MLEHKALIVNDWLDPHYDVKDVMRIYRKFASQPASASQPAPETRTRAPRQAKQVQYNFFPQNT